MTKGQLVLGLAVGQLLLLALVSLPIEGADNKRKDVCYANVIQKHCCRLRGADGIRGTEGNTAVGKSIIQDLFQCIREIISNFAQKIVEIPKICCNLPLFSLVCPDIRPPVTLPPDPMPGPVPGPWGPRDYPDY